MSQTPDKYSNLLSTLGLCARAGALIYGTDRVCEALRLAKQGQTPLMVLEAEGNSQNTQKKLSDKCTYYKVRHVILPVNSAALGAALGRGGELAAVGLVNSDLCRAVDKQLDRLKELT